MVIGNARVTVTKRQLSGEVSDETSVSVGRQLGTQMYTIQEGNVNITNNNTTTINSDVYVNLPGWFDPASIQE